MLREESSKLRELERDGAEDEIDQTVNDMADAYIAYSRQFQKYLGVKPKVSRNLKKRLRENLRKQLANAG